MNELDPDVEPQLWIASAEVSSPKDSAAVLQLYFGPPFAGLLRDPAPVVEAKVVVEYCDARGTAYGRTSAVVSTPSIREGMAAAEPIELKNIPTGDRRIEYLFIWLDEIDVSGEMNVFTWVADQHKLGLAVLSERLRLSDLMSNGPDLDTGIDRLVREVSNTYRE